MNNTARSVCMCLGVLLSFISLFFISKAMFIVGLCTLAVLFTPALIDSLKMYKRYKLCCDHENSLGRNRVAVRRDYHTTIKIDFNSLKTKLE